MRLEEVKCKACGARLDVKDGDESVTCPYCNVTYKIQDMEDSGYEFEKGRIKAQREHLKNLKPSNYALMIIPFVIVIIMMIVGISAGLRSGRSSGSSESAEHFNFGYNSGRTYGSVVESDVDDIINNNKTNKRKIAVKYNENKTDDPDEITELKKSIEHDRYYEISLSYDDKGYIDTYTIEIAKKTSQEIEHEAYSFNIYYQEGTLDGFFIQNALDRIILSNEKNANKQIVVKYNENESKEESDIERIKSSIKTNVDYKVRFEYDDEGYINKYKIED